LAAEGKRGDTLSYTAWDSTSRGILVRTTGRLDGDLMERFLLPKLPTTTGEQTTVLRSPTIIAWLVANRSRAAVCDDSAPENRTTDHDYVGSHNLPRRGSLELGTAAVQEDVPRTQNNAVLFLPALHAQSPSTLPDHAPPWGPLSHE
jgi:hypothetical protein